MHGLIVGELVGVIAMPNAESIAATMAAAWLQSLMVLRCRVSILFVLIQGQSKYPRRPLSAPRLFLCAPRSATSRLPEPL
ncbi:protein of unknown function (plasmid) [Cupriavidus taiwanensis]|uniref:Uncharacterized protein n=1 Tax=Cupriavidus taiwanensis TaxID=164546 RepID=A0A375IRG2_9BURK|nr:protein of unknown function [Cupriavidus taiwanensis]